MGYIDPMPRVSVIIPTHNRADMLEEALVSVLSQTYTDSEAIVVDDGSVDHTRETVAKYRGRVTYIYQQNQGRSRARNAGIEASQGVYLSFLDDDDVWYPRKLELQVSLLDAQLDVDVVYGPVYLVDEGSRRLLSSPPPHPGVLLEALISLKWIIPASASAITLRKSILERSGLFDRTLEVYEDWDLWIRIAACGGRFAQVDEPIAEYRMHATNTMRDKYRAMLGYIAALEKVFGASWTPPSIKGKREYYVSRAWLHLGNARYIDARVCEAWDAWFRAVSLDRSLLLVMMKSLVRSRMPKWARDTRDAVRRTIRTLNDPRLASVPISAKTLNFWSIFREELRPEKNRGLIRRSSLSERGVDQTALRNR